MQSVWIFSLKCLKTQIRPKMTGEVYDSNWIDELQYILLQVNCNGSSICVSFKVIQQSWNKSIAIWIWPVSDTWDPIIMQRSILFQMVWWHPYWPCSTRAHRAFDWLMLPNRFGLVIKIKKVLNNEIFEVKTTDRYNYSKTYKLVEELVTVMMYCIVMYVQYISVHV